MILFRDRSGRAGLLHARCCHRGTTLYYGKVEADGIRCCYHGWKFDPQGHCLEQPCEPEGGQFRHKLRQPWYPTAERYGLVFAYLGPPAKQPVLPRYECLDVLAEAEFVEADDSSIGRVQPIDSTRPYCATRGLGTTRKVGSTASVMRRKRLPPGAGRSDVARTPIGP